MEIGATRTATVPAHGPGARDPALWKAAQDFETVFLSQMFTAAGLAASRTTLGGGAGEEAFSGLLAGEQVRLFVERGGIGLARRIYAELAQP